MASDDSGPAMFDLAGNEDGEEVQRWLCDLGLGRYGGILQAEGFDDFRIIRNATEEDVAELVALCAMPRLHEKQFRRALNDLNSQKEVSARRGSEDASEPRVAAAGSSSSRNGEPLHGFQGPDDTNTWEVVGGRCAGGVLVRTGHDLTSPEAIPARLAFRAKVRELDLQGTRLQFELVSGRGPKTGWVSTKVANKELLVRCGVVREKERWTPDTEPGEVAADAASSDGDLPELVPGHAEESDEVESLPDPTEDDSSEPNCFNCGGPHLAIDCPHCGGESSPAQDTKPANEPTEGSSSHSEDPGCPELTTRSDRAAATTAMKPKLRLSHGWQTQHKTSLADRQTPALARFAPMQRTRAMPIEPLSHALPTGLQLPFAPSSMGARAPGLRPGGML